MKYINNAVIWVKKDKNGEPYFSFKADRDIKQGESLNLFKNDKGGVETRPDYRSYDKVEEEEQPTTEDVAGEIPFN